MKRFIFAIAALAAVCYGIHGCAASVERDDATRERNYREWFEFSQAHHCKIVSKPSWSNPNTTWECDGNFQVEHN